jgi:hypothetical protein
VTAYPGSSDEPSALDPLSVPELRTWLQDVGAASVWSYIGEGGSFAHAVAVLALCAPEFVETRGCVLLAERFEQKAFERWWVELRGDGPAIEQVVNHVHLWDVFRHLDGIPDSALEQVAQLIAEVWRALLVRRFPGRPFVVEVETSPVEYGPTLYLYQASRT